MKPVRFSPTLRGLHWLMAVLVIVQLLLGLWLAHSVSAGRASLLRLHETIGVCILLLVPIRLLVRLSRRAPPFPTSMPRLEVFAARLASVGLYALMLALPATGLLMLSLARYPVVLLGGARLPAFTAHDVEAFAVARSAHAWLAWTLLAAIFAHAAGVLVHALVLRDGVLGMMTSRTAPETPALRKS
jgi:cytochrome b561